MPAVKISELPAASSVSGTNQIEVNQGGISRRADLTLPWTFDNLIARTSVVVGPTTFTAQAFNVGKSGVGPQDLAVFENTDTGQTTSEARIWLAQGASRFQGISGKYNSGNPYLSFSVNTIDGVFNEQFRIALTASAVNYLRATGGATGAPGTVTLSAQGSDANVNLAITPKGTGTAVFNGRLRLKGYTVATLPAGVQGDAAFVTDALAPTFLAALTGGGAVVTPAFFDGTNWVSF